MSATIEGKFDYSTIQKPFWFGENESFLDSYQVGMDFLAECREVEDWGCGPCFARQFCRTRYIGVDFNRSQWTERLAELGQYISVTEGIFMRHVLEHNEDWRQILRNAVQSFQKRMALIFFLPFVEKTRIDTVQANNGLIYIKFSCVEVLECLQGLRLVQVKFNPKSNETIFLLEK